MLSAVTSRFKHFLWGNSHVKETRKRSLEEESEEEESSGFGEGEPAPKKSRLLTVNHDPPINRSYSQIGSKFCVGITKVYSFISGLSSPLFSSKDMTDSPDSSGQSLRVNVGGSRKSSRGKGLAESTTTAGEHFTRDKDPGPSGLDLTSSLMTNDDDIQFLGASSRTGYTDAPTKRPALGRRATAPEHSQPPVPSINPNFRFSPTVSPIAPQAPPDLTLRPSSKEPSWFKNSLAGRKVSYLNKKPGSLGRNPIKSLNEKCYGIQKKKQIRSTFLFHRGNSCAEESFRYEDKANYQQLLQQYTESSVLPSSSSNSTSPIACITRSRFNSFWTDEKRRQLEDTLSASRLSSTLAVDATASSDLATEKKSSTSDILLVDLVRAESTDSETDSVIFVKELTKPVSRSNSLESIIQESPVYNTDWLKSLREKYGNRSRAASDEAELAAEMQKRFEERRAKCHSSLEDRITHRMKFLDLTFPSKVEEIQPEEEEEEEEELVPLTSQM
ncbi:putative Sentrin-specific protease 1-like 3, partial [Homarus americanus]